MTGSDHGLPMLDSWLAPMAATCAISLCAMEEYSRLMSLESDDVEEPDLSEPDVVCATTTSGAHVFVDVSEGRGNAKPGIVADGDAVEDLEAIR